MDPIRRRLVIAASVLAATPWASAAGADAFPSKPIRLVVPYSPAGVVDNTARLLADRMSRALGQPVVVDNRAGANGQIGTEMVSRAPADGYTLLVTSVGFAYRQHLVKVPYDPFKDFEPLSLVLANPLLLVTHAKLPVQDVKELIQYSRSKAGGVRYGTSGTGGPSHLGGELFKTGAGIEMVHVPYKGDGQAVADLLAGNVDLTVSSLSATAAHIRAGKLRPLAVMANQRSSLFPEVPTLAEAGVPAAEAESWVAILGPAKLPPAVRQKLHAAVVSALADPSVRSSLVSTGSTVIGSEPQELANFLSAESRKWEQVIRKASIRIDE